MGVELEAGAGIVAGFYVVAGETREGDAAAWGSAGIAISGIICLLANVRACRHRNASTRGCGFGGSSRRFWGSGDWASIN